MLTSVVAVLLLGGAWLSSATEVRHTTRCHERRLEPVPANGPALDELISLDEYCGDRYATRWRAIPPPAPGASASTLAGQGAPPPTPAELAVQWLALLAAALVTGSLAFRAWMQERPGADPLPAPATARVDRLLTVGLWLLAAASLGETAASLGWLSGRGTTSSLDKSGALALLRLALAPMIGYLAGAKGQREESTMALGFAGMIALTRAQAGHASAGGFLAVLLDAAHQATAAAWLGGLAALVAALGSLAPTPRARAIARFGRLAAPLAAATLLSGLANGWGLSLDLSELPDTSYGWSLGAKLALVAALVVAAALVHRQRLAGLARAEFGIAAAVVIAAGVVALLQPPTRAAGAGPTFTLIRDASITRDADAVFDVRFDRLAVGVSRIEMATHDPSGAPRATADPPPSLAPIDGAASLQPRPAAPLAAAVAPTGGWQADFPTPGWWQLTLNVGGSALALDLFVPDPSPTPPASDPRAAERLAAVASRMDRLSALRSADLLSDARGGYLRVVTQLEAPDRLHAAVDGRDELTIVGPARFTRKPADVWRTARGGDVVRVPSFTAAIAGASSIRLGAADGQLRAITFFAPTLGGWVCWWVDESTDLVHRETLASRSLHRAATFDQFDQPVGIQPPV
ncbi:MAG: CopD family protein [Chloroflexota bacterium]